MTGAPRNVNDLLSDLKALAPTPIKTAKDLAKPAYAFKSTLLEYIPKISPEYRSPWHLVELQNLFVEALATIRGDRPEPLRALVTYPIRHMKTETVLHGVLWLLEQEPTLKIIVLAHAHDRAVHVGKRLRELAERTSVGPARKFNMIENWSNERGGGVIVMSADQSKEGHDCHVLLCDDPIDEHGARSQEKRNEVDRAINYYSGRCMRNGKPGAVILVMSRQDVSDPIGLRMNRVAVKWEVFYQPGIIDLGLETERAFAENVWPLAEIKKERLAQAESDPEEHWFWARIQGVPRSVASNYFRTDPARYVSVPEYPGFRDAMGIDLAFSKGRSSDWFAIAVCRFYQGITYVRSVKRFKADPRDVPGIITAMRGEFGDMPIFSYVSGPERGALVTLAQQGISVNGMQAKVNKLWRAQRVIAQWNDLKIMVPQNAEWVKGFLDRTANFRGVDGDDDDEIDALVSVCNAMVGASGAAPTTLGSWRY